MHAVCSYYFEQQIMQSLQYTVSELVILVLCIVPHNKSSKELNCPPTLSKRCLHSRYCIPLIVTLEVIIEVKCSRTTE